MKKSLLLLALLLITSLTFTSCTPDSITEEEDKIETFARETEPGNDGVVDDEEDTDEE